MRKAGLTISVSLLAIVTLAAAGLRADDKVTVTVTAVTHDAIVNERTSYHTTQGQSTTDCSGTGTDSGAGTTRINMDCNTTSTPAKTTSITTQTTEVNEKVRDSDNMVYTIACTDRPGWQGIVGGALAGASGSSVATRSRGACVPLVDGDQFDAEIKGTTMWVHARRGGNQGKLIKIKYKILDIRKLEAPVSDPNCKGDSQDSAELWKLGRSLGVKDDLITDGIKTMGVCSALFYTRRAYADKMGTSECVGDQWDTDRAMSLGRSLGEKGEEINDAIKQYGVCKVLSYLRQEQADRKVASSDPRTVAAPDIPQQAPAPLPALPTESQPAAPVALPSPVPPTSSDERNPRIGGGHWIKEISNNGAIVTLEDGSLWEVSTLDRVNTALWVIATKIAVLKSQSPVGDYTYTLLNKGDGQKALAKYLGKE